MHQCVHSSIVQGHWHIGKANSCTLLSLYVLAVKCIFISFHVDMCLTNDCFVVSLVKNKVGIVIIWHCCRAILLCLHTWPIICLSHFYTKMPTPTISSCNRPAKRKPDCWSGCWPLISCSLIHWSAGAKGTMTSDVFYLRFHFDWNLRLGYFLLLQQQRVSSLAGESQGQIYQLGDT